MKARDEHQWNGCGSEAGKDERKQYRKAKYVEPEETDGKPSRDGRWKTLGTKEPKEHRGAAVRRTGKKAEKKNRMLSNRKQGKSGRKKAKAKRTKEEAEHESVKRKA